MKIAPVNFRNSSYQNVQVQNKQTMPVYSPIKQPLRQDVFVSQGQINNKENKNSTLKTAFISGLSAIAVGVTAFALHNKVVAQKSSPYVKDLATSLGLYLREEVKPKQLASVISGKELFSEIKSLKKENFVASAENIKNGTFLADLHSHSEYSDGKAPVKTILNQVAKYADHVNKKTGKKFLYALTDHDNADGVKEALTIISKDPKKFKNVKFVTGSEMSFAVNSDKSSNPYETIEVLMYGFNPFNRKISKYIKGIHEKREGEAISYISELNNRFGYADFSMKEFTETYNINTKKECWLANSQWKLHHYGQTKNAVAGLANAQHRDKTEMYKEIMSKTDSQHKSLGDLRNKGLVPNSYGDDTRITDMCKQKYSPNMKNGLINYAGENKFDDIVEAFNGSDDTVMALAHPYYITEKTNKPLDLVADLAKRSKGMLKGAETYHQAYQHIDMNNLGTFNQSLMANNKTFTQLGGRDNHRANWLEIEY